MRDKNKIYFAKIDSPESFPEMKTINCGHRLIANFFVKLFNFLFGSKP